MNKLSTPDYGLNRTIIVHLQGSYAPPWGLSTLAKEFTAAARIMQRSSNELSTLVSGRV